MQAVVVAFTAALLAACGPGISDTRPCEEGFVEHARIETEQDIADLPRVKRVRRLEIIGSELETLEGLGCVEWVETLRIEDNPRLTALTGLEGLVEVDGDFCAEPGATAGCITPPILGDLGDVYELPPGVGDAIIANNPRLESMGGLDSLTNVRAMFEIRDNASLVSLDGLQALTYVALPGEMVWNAARSGLRIAQNPRLESLDALAAYVGGARLEIRDNPMLMQLFTPRMSRPERSGGLGALVLEDLPLLMSLDGLTNWYTSGLVLRRVPMVVEIPAMYEEAEPEPQAPDYRYLYHLILDSNASLRSIEGLSPIATIRGTLIIRDNDALPVLAGLEHLEVVSGGPYGDQPQDLRYAVLIEGNAELRDLDALDPDREGSFRGHLGGNSSAIRDNPELPTCLIERLLGGDSSWVVEDNGEQPCR